MNAKTEIVWHEFGHVFGYELVNAIYSDYIKITEISLKEKYRICPEKEEITNHDNSKIEKEKNILIFIMGAVFHVTKHKDNKNINFGDFSKISTNLERPLVDGNLYGYAGKDFFLLEKSYEKKRKNDLLKLTLEIQKELNKHNIYEKLESIINIFSREYNGKTVKGDDLMKEERRTINKKINTKLREKIKQMVAGI